MDLEQDSIEYPMGTIIPTGNTQETALGPVLEKIKPLKMIGFRPSKESDWILYGIHDPTYLAEKGLSRNIHYSFDDIQSTCADTLQDMITHLIDDRKGRLEVRIYDCIKNGLGWRDIVCTGIIPLRQIHNAFQFYQAVTWQIKDQPLYDEKPIKEEYVDVEDTLNET